MTADQIASAVAEWLTEQFGAPVSVVGDPVAAEEGLDNDIVFARFEGSALGDEWRAPLVLRSNPAASRRPQAEREAAIQGFLADRGYPVPRVRAVVPPAIQVIERVPGHMMLQDMLPRAWRIRRNVDVLAGLYARLHDVPIDGWPVPASPTELADRRLHLVHRVATDEPALARALERVEPLRQATAVATPVACHGDLHPMNVLVTDGSATVIDWTDACLGDRHGDIARMLALLEEARAGAPRAIRPFMRVATPLMARRLLGVYQRRAGPLDPGRLALWRPLHLLHDWARTLVTLSSPRDSVVSVSPKTVTWLAARFEAAVVEAQAQRGSGASGSIS
jgi:aminoglycoside phosphotransferase (APT) family kinase protein